MHNIKLTIAYDGKKYLGWQKTSMGISIEETLQKVIEQVLQEPIVLQAASRTDAGVHARGQIVNFLTSQKRDFFKSFKQSLNCLLPDDIVVRNIEIVSELFHPTLDCRKKEYRYYVCHGKYQLPEYRFYSWHQPYALDWDSMQRAAHYFIGQHHFEALCNRKKNEKYEHYTRTITTIELTELADERLQFKIIGNHFLYKMVRNIVGTIIYVGRGKLNADDIPKILSSKKRASAGMTAPAHGLTLYEVYF